MRTEPESRPQVKGLPPSLVRISALGIALGMGALAMTGDTRPASAQGVLGTQWAESELGWTGRWRRRGRSNVFDATWTHPRHRVVRAILYMRVTGNVVTITRRDTFGPGLGRGCRYRGVIRGNYVSGTYGCDWARGPFRWTARIYGQSGAGGGNVAAYCRNYATAAVNQQRNNLSRRCGYRGTRWQTNYANHYNWCIRAPQHARNREHNARVNQLRRCTGGGNAAAYCRNYATAAVNQQRANIARRCGYRGTRWQTNYANHYNWCIRSPQSARNREHSARVSDLNRCGRHPGIIRFNYPQVGGAILDHCWTWATNCGRPRANWYCRRRGHSQATTFGTYRPNRTYVVGSRRYCNGRHCVGYRFINCRR